MLLCYNYFFANLITFTFNLCFVLLQSLSKKTCGDEVILLTNEICQHHATSATNPQRCSGKHRHWRSACQTPTSSRRSCGGQEAEVRAPGGGAAATPSWPASSGGAEQERGAYAGEKPEDLLISNLTVLHDVLAYIYDLPNNYLIHTI